MFQEDLICKVLHLLADFTCVFDFLFGITAGKQKFQLHDFCFGKVEDFKLLKLENFRKFVYSRFHSIALSCLFGYHKEDFEVNLVILPLE